MPATTDHQLDVIVIGAGLSGMYQLHLLREAGVRVRVLEAGSDVGGTWYWNRYPGARLDSESYSYQYAFTKDLLAEWHWSETFAGQPELERYFQTVADRYDLRKDIDFDTRVASMTFDEDTDDWTVTTEDGTSYTAHLVITATGVLSAPTYPEIPGIERFRGESYHTGLWPHDREVTFEGKRVVVIGTGATGIQVITEVGRTAGHLTVFQRTPNWAIPLNNEPITQERMEEIRAGYDDMFPLLQSTFSGFLHDSDPTPTTAYDAEGLRARFEDSWRRPGFAKSVWLPRDVAMDPDANNLYTDFIAGKIRERVHDPKVAEMLIPTDHYFGTKRVPCESGYFETFNQPNVDLVSLRENPILEVTETGVRTAEGDIEADMIIYATGFEPFTGALKRIDITGVAGKKLAQTWDDGPVTYLGVQVSGFPNLFIMGGPHGKGGHGNGPRCAERVQEWMAQFATWILDHRIRRVEADPAAELAWTQHVTDVAEGTLMARTKSNFFFGKQREGRKRTYLAYLGSLPEYVERLQQIARDDYDEFVITR
jgi:cation diffusion facilitator CzcD-associated flavoprotein CzcO